MSVILNKLFEKRKDFYPSPSDRSISQDKLDKYSASHSYGHIIRDVCNNVLYIKFVDLVSKLRTLVSQVNDILDKYNILFIIEDGMKFGSEHVLTVLVWDLLKEKCNNVYTTYQSIRDDKNAFDYPLLIIDDCAYSGCSIYSVMDDLTYKISYTSTPSFHVILPFCSRFVSEFREFPFLKYMTLHIGEVLDNCSNIKSVAKEIENDRDFLYSIFGCEAPPLLIYFDHKIANEFGAFQFLYEVVNEKPSREGILTLEKHIQLNF
jgi:hypothetical protein